MRHRRVGACDIAHLSAGIGEDARDQRTCIGVVFDHEDANFAKAGSLVGRYLARAFVGERQSHAECRAFVDAFTLHRDGSVMDVDQMFDDGQPNT